MLHTAKVCDFGLAAVKTTDSQELSLVAGTPSYMAPEVLDKAASYSPLCDIWSIGIIIYVLLCGKLPFVVPRGSGVPLLDIIRSTELKFARPLWAKVTDISVKALLKRVLQIDPAARMTAKELTNHNWVQGGSSGAGSGSGGTVRLCLVSPAATAAAGGGIRRACR
jgi:serine/threonine protein kinase